MTGESSSIQWTGVLTSRPNELVIVPAIFDGIVVELFVAADYGTGFLDIEGQQDLCLVAYQKFCAFINERRIVKFRLLEWARQQSDGGWASRPEGHVESVNGSSAELRFDVSVGVTRFPVILEADLHPYWPGSVTYSTDEVLARAGLEVCYAHLDQDRDRFRDLGFDCSLLERHPGDPPIPGWFPDGSDGSIG
jgi:hypothetical protein